MIKVSAPPQEQIRAGSLPPLLGTGRRRLLAGLVCCGALIAVFSAAAAHMITVLLRDQDTTSRIVITAALLLMVLGVAGTRIIERNIAERLGQHYVHEIRKGLIASALSGARSPSIGITIARTTNDLNSVRNWVTMGVSAIAVGVPLIAGLTAALWFMSPPLALAVMIPLCSLSLLLGALARPAYRRSRTLRKKRGRLAAQISDTIAAAITIRSAGGRDREIGRIDRLGNDVAAAAVKRATTAGALRATSAATATITAIAVAATGSFNGISHATITAALTIVGMISGPVHELGRAVEYRQTYKAAKQTIGPVLAGIPGGNPGLPSVPEELQYRPHAPAASTPSPEKPCARPPAQTGRVSINHLRLQPGHPPLELPEPAQLSTGTEKIILARSENPHTTTAFFETVLGLRGGSPPTVVIDGQNYHDQGPQLRRTLIGYAARGLALERGTITRAVRYRHPQATDAEAATALDRAGLTTTIANLPKNEITILRRGGEPLSIPDRAKLQIARATLRDPPLLLLNHIDADLDPEGIECLARILEDYPGTCIIATHQPENLLTTHTEWHLNDNSSSVSEAQAGWGQYGELA